MGSIADKLQMLLSTKGSIRDAIIAKGQSVADADAFASYAAKILAIQTGFDTSDATVAAADILSGKTAYGPEGKITGTMPEVAQATPGISVSASGLITASATQGAGHVAAGTKSATQQLTAQSGTTITPGTSAKTAVASGRYTTGEVKVAGDANLTAGNIKSGVSIFGVMGNVLPREDVSFRFYNQTTAAFNIYYSASDDKNTKLVTVEPNTYKDIRILKNSTILFYMYSTVTPAPPDYSINYSGSLLSSVPIGSSGYYETVRAFSILSEGSMIVSQ